MYWFFKRVLGFLEDFHFFLVGGIPANFPSQMLFVFFFLALALWDGEPGLGMNPLAPQRDLCCWDIPPDSQQQYVGLGPALFASLLSIRSGCGFFCKPFVIRLPSASLDLVIQVDCSIIYL